MLVRIEQIRDGGRHLTDPVAQERLEELLAEADTGYGAAAPVRLDVHLDMTGDRVLVRGHLDTAVHGECKRCLGRTEVPVHSEFLLDLRPAAHRPEAGLAGEDRGEVGEGESAGSFRLDEAEEDVYEGEELDVWPLVREQILLALPEYVLCDESCKGLCPVCGADLNKSECGCDRTVPDPRWAALKDIKLT